MRALNTLAILLYCVFLTPMLWLLMVLVNTAEYDRFENSYFGGGQ